MEVINLSVAGIGALLSGGALVYGCIHTRPGSASRWLVFGAVAILADQLVWLPVLAVMGIGVSVADQVYGAGILLLVLKWLIDWLFPRTVWAVWVNESEDE